MSKSADLIQSNSQIFRVYFRRLSNPGDPDIFIASARKLTAFLSNTRAYYTEAQQPIVDLLEVACNSLKNVVPDAFSTPGSIDRSVIPDDRVPLFDAFVKLANSVTPYLHLFADESLNNRLRSFLSSIGVALPSATINVTSPDTSIRISTLSSAGPLADSTTSQATSSVGAAPSDSQVVASPLSPSIKETASRPTSAPLMSLPSMISVAESSSVSTPVQVPSVAPSKVNTSDGGDVVRSIPNQQTVPLPPSGPLHQHPLPQAPVPREVVDLVPEKPNPHDRVSRPHLPSLLPTSSIPPSLHTKLVSPVPASGTIPPSQESQPAPSVTHVVTPLSTYNVTSQDRDPQTVLESSVSSPQVRTTQAPQSVPPSQVQVPVQTPATSPGISSEQQKPKPMPRRQSSGLDFLQLDLQEAREKKQRAAAQAAEAKRSRSPAQVSAAPVSSPVPSISKKVSLSPATATPTSATPVGMPSTPSAQTFPHAVLAVAQASPAHILTHSGTEPKRPPANVSSESKVLSATSEPPSAQTPSPSLVHRDLRQGSTRNGSSLVSPRKLQITDRAPVPAPEPGSENAPIVVDEDEEPAPADERTKAVPKTEELITPAPDFQDVRESRVDTKQDRKSQPELEGQAIREQMPQENVSVPELPSRLPVSGPELSTTSTLQVNVPVQRFSAPSTPSPLSSVSTPAVPAPRPLVSTAPSSDKLQGALPQQATDDKEIQNGNGGKDSMDTDTSTTSVVVEPGKTAEDPVEGQGRSSVDIVSVATVEPPLGSDPGMGSAQPPAGITASPKSRETKITSSAPPVAASVTSVTGCSPSVVAISPAIPAGAEPTKSGPIPSMDVQVHALHQAVGEPSSHSSLTGLGPIPISEEHIPIVSVAEPSPTSGKHQRSPTPDGQTRRVMVRKESPGPISEGQQDLPLHSDTVKPTSFGTVILDTRPGANEGRPETALGTSFPLKLSVSHGLATASGNASGSTLPVPTMVLHKRIESLSDMDISRSSISPPPIAVLGTRTGGSSVTNRSSNSRSTSPPSGKRLSEGGIEAAKVEELEDDEMVDELAPLFGKEMRVLCMDRAYDVPGEFTWDFTLPNADWDRVSQWAKAPENPDLDISQARCITLACYSTQDLEPYASQVVMAREQWFENTKPVPWAKLPRSLWALINDEFTVVFPPYMSPDDLFDVSPFLRPGLNKISFRQIDGMAEYVFVLHGHYPTRGQLEPLHARWEQERYYQEQLAWLSRPFSIEW